jgi:hypothetical protein
LWALKIDGDGTPFPVAAQPEHGERSGRFFPVDGSWVAYDSTESGRREIWLQRFMDPDGRSRRPVSTAGGVNPQWRADGGELFYVADGMMMAVTITQRGTSLEWGRPQPLFPTLWAGRYAVRPDGQQFLVPVPPGLEDVTPITVVVNWLSMLQR